MTTKDELIEKYRDINVSHEWWDGIYEMVTEDMKNIGFSVDKIHFSGFWSQGDGACFVGAIDNWELFLKHTGYDNPLLIELAHVFWSFRVSHSSRYYHESSVSFNIDMPNPDDCSLSDVVEGNQFIEQYCPYAEDFRCISWFTVLKQYDFQSMERDFKETFKNCMRDVYSKLYDEYYYLTSDEAVWDTLVANEMFDEMEEICA